VGLYGEKEIDVMTITEAVCNADLRAKYSAIFPHLFSITLEELENLQEGEVE
jgi:hypothetical protein